MSMWVLLFFYYFIKYCSDFTDLDVYSTYLAEFLVFSEYVVMPQEIHIMLQLNYFFWFTLQVIIKSKKAGVDLKLNPP